MISLVIEHAFKYGVPTNLTYLYALGYIISITMVIQILSGFVIALSYNAFVDGATIFDDVLTGNLNSMNGYVNRYLHATYPSVIMFTMYAHAVKSIIHSSSLSHLVTRTSGLISIVVMYAVAFMGYSIAYGNMSFWAATVILNLLSSITNLVMLLNGHFSVTSLVVNRLFVLHYILGLAMLVVMVWHLAYLHASGSTNSMFATGTLSTPLPFTSHTFFKDLSVVSLALFGITGLVIGVGYIVSAHSDNHIPVSVSATPAHIVPESYLLGIYGGLKVVLSMTPGLSIVVLIILTTLLMVLPTA